MKPHKANDNFDPSEAKGPKESSATDLVVIGLGKEGKPRSDEGPFPKNRRPGLADK